MRASPHAPPRPQAPASVGGQPCAHDPNGALTSGGGRAITWDARTMPASVTGPDGVTETCAYDADDARVSRTRQGATTCYLGDGVEEDRPSGQQRATVAFAGRAIAMRDGVVGVTDRHGDHPGSVSMATNTAGAVVAHLAQDGIICMYPGTVR